MISLLNDISVLHDKNQICILNGRKSVGDNKAGPSLHQVIHSLLDLHFCSCINGRCGLIQDQDLIVCQDRSCNGKQLLLPLRNITGLLIQDHLITAGLLHDKVVDMGRFCCCDHLFIRCVQPSVADIFHNGSGKQPGVLQHHSEHLTEIAAVEVPDIMSVNLDASAIYIIKTHQQLYDRRFSCACRSYNGDLLTVMHIRGKIIYNDLIRVVAEFYMLKLYISFQSLNRIRILRLKFFLRLLQEFKYTLGGCRGRLQKVCNLCDLLDRLCKVTDVLEKGLNISNLNGSPDGKNASKKCHHHIAKVSYKLHDWHHHSGKELGFPCRLIKLLIITLKFFEHVLFFIEHSYYIMTTEVLLYLAVYFSKILLLCLEIFL